jgi:serine/threonine-protein kinase
VGLLLWDKGDLDGAEKMLRENVETSERVLGAGHANVASAKVSLGGLLIARGDAAAGEALLRGAVETRREIFGERHEEFGAALIALAYAVELQGRLDQAQTLVEQGLAIVTAALGEEHPAVISATLDLVRIRLARDERRGLEPIARRAFEIREKTLPAGDWRIAQAQSLLGATLVAERRYADAKPLMLAADQSLKPVPGRQAHERDANRRRLDQLPAPAR